MWHWRNGFLIIFSEHSGGCLRETKNKRVCRICWFKKWSKPVKKFWAVAYERFFFGVFFFCVLQSLRSNEKTKGEEARSVFFLLPLPDHFLAWPQLAFVRSCLLLSQTKNTSKNCLLHRVVLWLLWQLIMPPSNKLF